MSFLTNFTHNEWSNFPFHEVFFFEAVSTKEIWLGTSLVWVCECEYVSVSVSMWVWVCEFQYVSVSSEQKRKREKEKS